MSPDGKISAQKISAPGVNGTGNASCYLWCTPDGNLPSAHTEEAPTIGLISELKSRLDDVHNRSLAPPSALTDDEKLEALSPVRIYKFDIKGPCIFDFCKIFVLVDPLTLLSVFGN